MIAAIPLDPEVIACACEEFGASRLRVFGSVLTDHFDMRMSDVDFLVDFYLAVKAFFTSISSCKPNCSGSSVGTSIWSSPAQSRSHTLPGRRLEIHSTSTRSDSLDLIFARADRQSFTKI
jgi:hypothetical protein